MIVKSGASYYFSKGIEYPICKESFVDLRGLTSHARHTHELSKEEIYDLCFMDEKDEKGDFWKVLAGAGAFLLALITLGRVR